MSAYLKYFAAVYSIALVLMLLVLIFIFNLGVLTLLPALIAAALLSARHFVRKEQRIPTNHEKIQLVWGSSAVAICIGSFFAFFIVMLNPNAEQILQAVDQAGLGLYALVMLCLVALHAAIFHSAYAWYADAVLKRL